MYKVSRAVLLAVLLETTTGHSLLAHRSPFHINRLAYYPGMRELITGSSGRGDVSSAEVAITLHDNNHLGYIHCGDHLMLALNETNFTESMLRLRNGYHGLPF